ncbi:MAG: 30S ribosomal protein S9 [Chloroflexota bacterium]
MAEYIETIGRRKSSTARVRIYPGTGEIVVNELPMETYFGRSLDRMILKQPLVLTGTENSYNISIRVKGGGDSGQASAVRHGISRGLCELDSALRPSLKAAGFLTRDSREKERKKPGLKRARKAKQYTKR